jgi:hypothetical protein
MMPELHKVHAVAKRDPAYLAVISTTVAGPRTFLSGNGEGHQGECQMTYRHLLAMTNKLINELVAAELDEGTMAELIAHAQAIQQLLEFGVALEEEEEEEKGSDVRQ